MIRSTEASRTLRLACAALAGLAIGAIVACPSSVRAEEPSRAPTAENLATARDSLREGMAQRDAGDAAGALPKLHLAYTLVATPVTGYELGKTHAMLGQLLSAREAFLSVGRMPRSLDEGERSETARRESARLAEELEPHVPRLAIHLTLPEGATASVTVDGIVLPAEALVSARRVNPGVHEVTAKAGDGEPVSTKVELRPDETKDVTLAPRWVAPKPPAPPPRPYFIRTSPNPLLYVGVVAGAVGLVAGTTTFVLGQQERSAGLADCAVRYCPLTTQTHFNNAAAYQVGVGTSIGLAAAGVALSVWAIMKPKTEKIYARMEPFLGPGSAGLWGTF